MTIIKGPSENHLIRKSEQLKSVYPESYMRRVLKDPRKTHPLYSLFDQIIYEINTASTESNVANA